MSDSKIISVEPETINLTPTWETAVRIYIACLENPAATAESKEGARQDLLKLAKMVDDRNSEVRKDESKV